MRATTLRFQEQEPSAAYGSLFGIVTILSRAGQGFSFWVCDTRAARAAYMALNICRIL